MKHKIIKKEDIAELVDGLLDAFDVFAPVKKGQLVIIEQVSSGSEVVLDYSNSANSPKEVLFPQAERLFSHRLGKQGDLQYEIPPVAKKRIVLGIRPCDARSFTMLNCVFNDGIYKDPYFLNKRAATIVVGLGCNKPKATCFCTSVGGGPHSTDGTDLMLIDIGEVYVIQETTERGVDFLATLAGLADASENSLLQIDRVMNLAESRMKVLLPINELDEKLADMSDDFFWNSIHEKCLGCGICTYHCPTCHCFDIVDEGSYQMGDRVRIWDSCQFRLFTQETSGVNPRPTPKERLRHKIMCKFHYFMVNHSKMACVGCGRCVLICPVNLDIRKVLADLSAI